MSCYNHLLIFMLLLLFLLQPSALTPPPTNHHHHLLHRQQRIGSKFRSCDSFSGAQQRSLCFQLQRLHNSQPSLPLIPPPPPPSELDEIDPRYGVEKRLVPSGPNPLHH
ncbi:hypothetical protein PTKIN_Ptkin17bG0150300 [Pterospermum kingtungense]